MSKTNNKVVARSKRIGRIRKKISGTPERPRLCVFKSAKHTYAQIIDDTVGQTLCFVSTLDKELKTGEIAGKAAKANLVGQMLAEQAKAKGIQKVVFDRGGYLYHGRVKSLSEGAREGGLDF